ncbi:MAG: helix-turn-helix domain-containing protein [Rubrivivax sp.]|nr:helix-turn-helix domain-containing protein [Rubrivivax sp.]
MSQKEAQRYAVVQRLVASEMSQAQAALVLGISVRQVKRLCRRVREQGPAGLVSRKRGVPSNRRIAPLGARAIRRAGAPALRRLRPRAGARVPGARSRLCLQHRDAPRLDNRSRAVEGPAAPGQARAQPARAPRLRGRVGADRRQPPRLVRGPC